jgi:predicted nucleotidyltransferase
VEKNIDANKYNSIWETIPVDVQSELHNISKKIIEMYPGAKVILFGSYARGEQHKWSDLDICAVIPNLPKRVIEMMDEVRFAISGLTHLPLDVLIYEKEKFDSHTQSKSYLEYTINKEGIKLNA